MKKNLFLLIITAFIMKNANAQNDRTEFIKRALAVKDTAQTALIILKQPNGKSFYARNFVLRKSEIQSFNVLSNKDFFAAHPNQKAKTVIEIVTTPDVHLLNYRQILDKYKILSKYRSYQLKIGIKPSLGGNTYASEDAIQSVEVDSLKKEIIIYSKPD